MTALYLYDDAAARAFEPFALTRPVAALRAGIMLVQERWERALGMPVTALLGAAQLAEFSEPGIAPVARGGIPAGSIVANARFAPALDSPPRAARHHGTGANALPDLWLASGRGDTVAARTGRELPVEYFADGGLSVGEISRSGADTSMLGGWWLDAVWDLVGHLAPMLGADIAVVAQTRGGRTGAPTLGNPPAHAAVVGSHPVLVAPDASIEPYVVLDASAGPILIDERAVVQAFTRIVGPCYIGRASTILGDRVAACAIGDHCKVRGEISMTVVLGHANKGHDGFVGHSYLGRWTNLGAGTITSNLKNTYGTVSLWTPSGMRDTGMHFLGTLFGDHAKTGIGTSLTTGTVIGAGANVYGGRMPPKAVAPFSWGDGAPYAVYRLEKFLEVAERVMDRRHVALTAAMRAQLAAAHARRWTVEEDA